MKTVHLVSLLASICMTGAASAAWVRVPAPEATPVNLASKILAGTKIQSSEGITNADALLADSASEAVALSSGASNAVITLGEQQMVENVYFLNDGAAGTVTVSSSADLKEWLPLAKAEFKGADREVSVKFAGVQAKYVRVGFEVSTAASIRNFKLSGPAKTSDYKAIPVKDAKGVDVNLSSGALGAKPIYMFPTPANAGDSEGAAQSFKFPKTKERYRTVVYDLGSVRTIKKFSAAYSRVPTRVQVFAFEQLPEKKDWRGKLTLDPAVFDTTKPVASAEDAAGNGTIQISPSQPVKAQFVALRFEPNYNKRAVAGLDSTWEAMAFAAFVPFGGIVDQLVPSTSGVFTQDAGGADDFTVFDAASGGTVPLVVISKAAIAKALQEMGPNATETQAINAILAAAGFTPLTNTGAAGTTNPDGTTSSNNNPQSQVADPSAAPGNTAGLNALGLSAYRGGGGGGTGGAGSPFTTTDDGPPAGTGNPGTSTPPTSAAPSPIIIAPTTN